MESYKSGNREILNIFKYILTWKLGDHVYNVKWKPCCVGYFKVETVRDVVWKGKGILA